MAIQLIDAFQDGREFYRESDRVLLASFPSLVANDWDMEGAVKAREAFARAFPEHAAEDDGEPECTNTDGHEFACTGTAYGGDDERWHGEGRCLCIHCGADGDA